MLPERHVVDLTVTPALFQSDGSNCSGIATVVAGAPGNYTVYPSAAGHCDIIVTDARNGSTTVSVSVTTTTLGGQ